MWSITASIGLLFVLGPIMPSAFQSKVIPDLVAPTGDERRALEIKKERFWEPFVKTAEEAASVGHAGVYAAVEASIGALPKENTHVRSLLEDGLARLRVADAEVLQQILRASEAASEHLADVPDSDRTASSFLTTGESIVSWTVGRIVGGGGRYSKRVNEQVASRQTDVLPIVRGEASVDVLEECREVAKIGFDVLKYDVYSQSLASTPEIALTAANRLIQASDETRHRFLTSVEGTADIVAEDTREKDADPSAVVTRDLVSDLLPVMEEFHDKGLKDVPSKSVSNERPGFARLGASSHIVDYAVREDLEPFGEETHDQGESKTNHQSLARIGASSHVVNYTVREDLEPFGEETYDQGENKTNHRSLPSQSLLEAKARVEVAWAHAKADAEAEQAQAARAEVEVSQALARAEFRAAEAQARVKAEVAKTLVKMEAGDVHARADIKDVLANHAESLSNLAPDFWAHVQADSQDEQEAMTKDARRSVNLKRTLLSEWEPHGHKLLSEGTGGDEQKDEHLAIVKQTVSTEWEEFGQQIAIKEQDSRLSDTWSSRPIVLSEWQPASRKYTDLAMDSMEQKNTTSAIVSGTITENLEPFGQQETEDGAGVKTVYRSAVARPILLSQRESLFGGQASSDKTTANEADSVSKMARTLFTDWEPARTPSGENMERDTTGAPTIVRKTLLSRLMSFGYKSNGA